MRFSQPIPVPETSACCPNCHYNFTGLTEPRCPECGRRVDSGTAEAQGLPIGNVLLMIDVFAVILTVLIVCVSSGPINGSAISDSVVVQAMMAPLQLVLISAAIMAGLHLLRNNGSPWLAGVGMAIPAVAGAVSLISLA